MINILWSASFMAYSDQISLHTWNPSTTVCNYSCLPSVFSVFVGDCANMWLWHDCDRFYCVVRLRVTDLPCKISKDLNLPYKWPYHPRSADIHRAARCYDIRLSEDWSHSENECYSFWKRKSYL